MTARGRIESSLLREQHSRDRIARVVVASSRHETAKKPVAAGSHHDDQFTASERTAAFIRSLQHAQPLRKNR